jgi:hypothetical protein
VTAIFERKLACDNSNVENKFTPADKDLNNNNNNNDDKAPLT